MYHRELFRTRIRRDSAQDRWLPAVSMWLVSLISYVDRNTLAILAPVILRDTHLNAEQYGFIISCFSVAYMIGNPVWGRILDRWGVRRGMTAAVGIWTVASAAHAWAGGFWSFGIARAVLGAGEGATFPGGLRTVTQTLPPSKRGRGLAIAYSGGSLGRHDHAAHRHARSRCASAGTGHSSSPDLFGARVADLLAHSSARAWTGAPDPRTAPARCPGAIPRFWAFMAAYGAGRHAARLHPVRLLALPARALRLDQATLGKVLWIPPFGWEVGYFFWGAMLDRFGPRFRGLMLVSLLLSLPLAWMHSLPTGVMGAGEMFLAMFALGGLRRALRRTTPRARSRPAIPGLLAGIGAGSWGAMVALTSPWFGQLVRSLHSTQPLSGSRPLFPVAGYLLWRAQRPSPARPSM